MANKLKYNHSKGGLRDRSRDFISLKKRDPSIKFPGSSRQNNLNAHKSVSERSKLKTIISM